LSLRAFNQPDAVPHYLLEPEYECVVSRCPNAAGFLTNDRQRLRRQAYWAILSGGTGHFFGNEPTWNFAAGWDGAQGIGSPGNQDMERLNEFFTSHAWYNLVPDQNHATVTAGYGTYAGPDYVTAGRTPDGSLVMAYVPPGSGTTPTGPVNTGARTLTVNMAQLSGPATAQWFSPATGVYSTIAGSPFTNSGSRSFTTPGDNGTGTNDWVLVLQAG